VSSLRVFLGHWFASTEQHGVYFLQIYEGLHKLLGEPVPVANNLTWTLVKFINPDSCDVGNIESDLLAESYCKLNLALSLMHECFEPLKESLTCRDIVEDVIFSRRSEIVILQDIVTMFYVACCICVIYIDDMYK